MVWRWLACLGGRHRASRMGTTGQFFARGEQQRGSAGDGTRRRWLREWEPSGCGGWCLSSVTICGGRCGGHGHPLPVAGVAGGSGTVPVVATGSGPCGSDGAGRGLAEESAARGNSAVRSGGRGSAGTGGGGGAVGAGGGGGYPLVTFTVRYCYSNTREARTGSSVRACLGRHLYIVWGFKPGRGSPTVDAFRAENPTCVRLVRGSSDLRAAVQASAAESSAAAAPLSADAAAAIARAPHPDRLLLVRGKEGSSVTGGEDLSSITLLLEAPTAALCAAWAAAGSSLVSQWEPLLRSSLSRGDEAAAVKAMLDWTAATGAPAANDKPGAASAVAGPSNRRRLLEAANWLNVASPTAVATASVLRKGADTVDAVTGVPTVGPAVRLALLAVQAGALAVRTDEHGDLRVEAAKKCGEVVRRLLERTLHTMRLAETEFGSVHVEQLCGLLDRAESVMEEVEGTVFSSGWRAALQGDSMRRWGGEVGTLHIEVLSVCAVGAIGVGVDELKVEMSSISRSMDAARALPADDPELDAHDLGWRAITPVPGYVSGVDSPERAEYSIVQELLQYKAGGSDKAPRVGVCAIGGSGKTTACAGVAASAPVREHFSVVWIHMGDTVSPQMIEDAVVALTLRFCGRDTARRLLRLPTDADVVGTAARYMQSVGVPDAAKWLVIVDDVVYGKHDWLLRLLQVVPTATPVLFTTRAEPVVALVSGAQLVAFDALPARDAKALLAKALRRPVNGGEPPFSSTEEEAWVDSVLDMTGRHALSLSILGAVIAAKRGAWHPVLQAMKEQLKHLDYSLPPGGLDSPRSVRATLATSLALLPDESCRAAFAAVGVLPTSVLVGVPVLARLWRPQLEVAGALGQCRAHDDRGRGISGGGRGYAVAASDADELVDVQVGAGLIRCESDADRGLVTGVV
ncbi:hypothetical protein BU14_0630s0001, partial [Porphyra umbilicalis]